MKKTGGNAMKTYTDLNGTFHIVFETRKGGK